MSGIFGIVSKKDCICDTFYGTDYNSHLGTKFGGMAVFDGKEIQHDIKKISLYPFRPQLSNFKENVNGNMAIGIISDYEPQPLIINSHLGEYAIVHVGKVNNLELLVQKAHKKKIHFSESSEKINPTELVAALINQGKDFVDGIEIMQNSIEGSSSVMLLTKEGIYLARDKYGRTPIITGKKDGATAATLETCAFPNTGFKIDQYLGPGEVGIITSEGYEQLKKPGDILQICAFLFIYYGHPPSNYEKINVQITRNKCGAIHAKGDKEDKKLKIDYVAGIPDSGTPHAIGYANESRLPYNTPYIKYFTWQKSFMPTEQEDRDLVADMKLIPIEELIRGFRILFNEDSIVRGTQLKKKIRELYDYGAEEVHMRPACPPLTEICNYLNFSISRSVFDLAARRAIRKIEGKEDYDIFEYLDEKSEKYEKMVDVIRMDLGLKTLKYQKLNDMVSAIDLEKEKLCTTCWDGVRVP